MTESGWTLEAELCGLASETYLREALARLGLLLRDARDFELVTTQDWYRSGAETYSLRFAVRADGRERSYFMKACVAYEGGTPLPDIFATWLARRETVTRAGVSTPRLHAAGRALLVEEDVPLTLIEALRSGQHRPELMQAIGATVARLLNAGFAPLSTHDWRSRRHDVVLVDFGQDLGPPNLARDTEAGLLSEVLDSIARERIELSSSDLRTVARSYEENLGR